MHYWDDELHISIHTPAKGVTAVLPAIPADADYFNPHSREGSDNKFIAACNFTKNISIHTPAKGVTKYLLLSLTLP